MASLTARIVTGRFPTLSFLDVLFLYFVHLNPLNLGATKRRGNRFFSSGIQEIFEKKNTIAETRKKYYSNPAVGLKLF